MRMKEQSLKQQHISVIHSQYLVAAVNNSSKVFEIIYLIQSRSMIKVQKFTLGKSTKHFLKKHYSRNGEWIHLK